MLMTRRVHHAHGAARALAKMLAGSGYAARQVSPTAWRIEVIPSNQAPMPGKAISLHPSAEGPTILVTAGKRVIPLGRLARSVEVVSLSDMASSGAASGTSLIAGATEGLTLTSLGPGRNRMFLRGVADSPFDGASQSTVAVLVNDSRLTYFEPDPDLRLVDVARVELLKGPQGSLYGTGALGGVYHIVTNPANVNTNSGMASAGYAGVKGGGVGGSGSGMANLALAPGVVGLRVVGYVDDQPGWLDTGPSADSNATLVKGGRADMGFDAGGWRIDLGGLFQRIDTSDSQYTYAPNARNRPAQLAEPHDNDLNQVSWRGAGRIGAVDAVLVTSYSWHEVKDTLDATEGTSSFGLTKPQLFQDFRWYTVWDSEGRFNGTWGKLQWLAGLDHVVATEHEWRNLTSAGGALVIDDSHSASQDTGVFTNLTLPITDRLSIEAGGRLYNSEINASRLASGTVIKDEVDKTGVMPSAALIWHRQTGGVLWLRYGAAFRQGGLDYDADGKVHAFAGDQISTLEVGWREQISGGGQIDADGFFTRWNDMQSDMLLPNGLIETRNAGNARIFGGEATVTQPLGKGWHVSLGATVQSAELVQNFLGVTLDDRRLPSIPEYTLRGGLDLGFRFAGGKGKLALSARYIGPARLSFDPRLDRPMGKVLDSHFDASLDWGSTTLALRIDNLLNRASDTFAYGNPFRVGEPQYTPQPPLSTALSLTRKF